MKKKILIYGLITSFLVGSVFGLFALKTNAMNLYSPYYNYNNTYPYQQSYNYGNYGNTYPYQNYGQNYGSNYPTYGARPGDTCPLGFVLTTYNGTYGCFKFLNGNNNYYNGYDSNNYGYNYNYNNYSYGYGCEFGNRYSITTGERCDDYYDNNYYDDNGDLRGNDATIRNFEMNDGDDDNPQEGDNDAEIAQIQFDVEDADVRLDRAEIDFEFTGNNNVEDKPWNTFDEIRILVDGDEVDSINTDDNDEWNKEDDDTYSITFTGIDEIIRENDSADITIEADISSNVIGSRNNATWDIFVPDRGIRARDGNGDTIYTGDDGEKASIDIER